MEVIEHFHNNEACVYIKNVAKMLNSGGFFICSSAFPESAEEAEKMLAQNNFHHTIFTKPKIQTTIEDAGLSYKYILNNWILFAQKN